MIKLVEPKTHVSLTNEHEEHFKVTNIVLGYKQPSLSWMIG